MKEFFNRVKEASKDGVGSIAKEVLRSSGVGLKSIAHSANEPLKTARKNFTNAEGVGGKIGWGFATAGAAGLRTGASLLGVAGAMVKSSGNLVKESVTLLSSASKMITSPRTLSSYTKTGSALTRVGAELVMMATSPMKQFGTEIKDLGNNVKVPGLTQTLRVMGGGVQSLSQATEGVVQGLRKMAVLEGIQGAKVMGAGLASAGMTIFKDGGSIYKDGKSAVDNIRGKEAEAGKKAESSKSPQNVRLFNERLETARTGGKFKVAGSKTEKPEEDKKTEENKKSFVKALGDRVNKITGRGGR